MGRTAIGPKERHYFDYGNDLIHPLTVVAAEISLVVIVAFIIIIIPNLTLITIMITIISTSPQYHH